MEVRKESAANHSNGMTAAFQNLTDNLVNLLRQHIDLVKYEVKEEAQVVGKNVAIIAICAIIALIGYIFLNLAAILIAFWLGGVAAMALTALGIAVLNLGISAGLIYRAQTTLKDSPLKLDRTTKEIQRDKEWIKQIRNTPSPEMKALNSQDTNRPIQQVPISSRSAAK